MYYALGCLLCPEGSSHTSMMMMMMIVSLLHYEFVQQDDKTLERMHNMSQSEAEIHLSTGWTELLNE